MSYVIPSLGAEKSQHLWELIKAKLASLNLYTDDVLSEYIMVLLQGGNGKEKIYEELVIFMNSPELTEHFVLWLFGEIEKLLSVSVQVSEPVALPSQSSGTTDTSSLQDDVQMGSGNRLQSTRSFSRALEGVKNESVNNNITTTSSGSVKSNIHNAGRRTFSTEQPSTSESREYQRDGQQRRGSPQRNNSSNRRIVRNVTEDGNVSGVSDGVKVQKIKLSVDFDRDEKERSRPGRRTFKKIQINNEGGSEQDAATTEPPVIRVKCQYWPNCRAGDSCPNVHPSETCKHFPNCQFGDSCTFLHPSIPCKFQEKCQNPLCNYQHRPVIMMGTGMGMMGAPVSVSGTSTILCKFYPRCVNVNCPYLHPVKVQCRYGTDCSRPDCPFEHPSGRKGAHLKSVVFAPCKYGKQCARADCPYQHNEIIPEPTAATETEQDQAPQTTTSMMQ